MLLDSLPLFDAGKNLRLFFDINVARRFENIDRAADDLCGCVPVEAFGARVPTGDVIVQAHGDYRVFGRFYDGRQIRLRLLRLTPARDVNSHPDEAWGAVELNQAACEEIRNQVAALGDEIRFDGRFALGEELLDPFGDHLLVGFADKVQWGHFRNFFARIAADFHQVFIPAEELSLVGEDIEGTGETVHDHVTELLLHRN